MELGLSIGLFCGFSIFLVLLYCLTIYVRHRLLVDQQDQLPGEIVSANAMDASIDLSTVGLRTASNRSKTMRKEGLNPNDIVNAVVLDQLPANEQMPPVEATVYLAYKQGSRLRVLTTTLLSFQKKLKIFQNTHYTINFRKRIEDNDLGLDEPDAAEVLKTLGPRLGVRKIVTLQPPDECKLDVQYPMQQMREVDERWENVLSVEEGERLQRSQF